MRSQDFFQQLQEAGYVCKRVSSSHFIFSRDGRRTIPVTVHDHNVRKDVEREVLKKINVSDEVYRERYAAMRSAKLMARAQRKKAENIRVDEDEKKNGGRNGRRRKGNKNAKKRTTNVTNTSASSSSSARAQSPSIRTLRIPSSCTAAAHEWEKLCETEKDERRAQAVARAQELVSEAPQKIAIGECEEVADAISALLRESSGLLEETLVLDLTFMGVIAWLEAGKALVEDMKMKTGDFQKTRLESILNDLFTNGVELTEANSTKRTELAAHLMDELSEIEFNCKDAAELLRKLSALETVHWRHVDRVKEVRVHAVQEMFALHEDAIRWRETILEEMSVCFLEMDLECQQRHKEDSPDFNAAHHQLREQFQSSRWDNDVLLLRFLHAVRSEIHGADLDDAFRFRLMRALSWQSSPAASSAFETHLEVQDPREAAKLYTQLILPKWFEDDSAYAEYLLNVEKSAALRSALKEQLQCVLTSCNCSGAGRCPFFECGLIAVHDKNPQVIVHFFEEIIPVVASLLSTRWDRDFRRLHAGHIGIFQFTSYVYFLISQDMRALLALLKRTQRAKTKLRLNRRLVEHSVDVTSIGVRLYPMLRDVVSEGSYPVSVSDDTRYVRQIAEAMSSTIWECMRSGQGMGQLLKLRDAIGRSSTTAALFCRQIYYAMTVDDVPVEVDVIPRGPKVLIELRYYILEWVCYYAELLHEPIILKTAEDSRKSEIFSDIVSLWLKEHPWQPKQQISILVKLIVLSKLSDDESDNEHLTEKQKSMRNTVVSRLCVGDSCRVIAESKSLLRQLFCSTNSNSDSDPSLEFPQMVFDGTAVVAADIVSESQWQSTDGCAEFLNGKITNLSRPQIVGVIRIFHELAVREEKLQDSIGKLLKSHRGTKEFKAVLGQHHLVGG